MFFSISIRKYNTLPRYVKAGFWFTVSGFLQKSIAFITLPIFTRLLNPDEYGIVTIFNSWETMFLLLVTLNVFYGAFNTAMMDFENERDAYTSSLVGLILFSGCFWFFIYYLFNPLFNSFTGMTFLMSCVMFVQIVSQGIVSVWLSRCKFDYEYRSVVISTLVLFGLSPVLSIIGIEMFPNNRVEAKIIGNSFAYLFVATYAATSILRKNSKLISNRYWLYALVLSAPLLIHYLSTAILGQSDRIMIGKLDSDSKAAIYAVAYSVSMAFSIVTTSASQAIVPRLYSCIKVNELSKMKNTVYVILGIVAVSISILMLIGPEIVKLLAPSEYYDASWIIPPVMASMFFTFLFQLFANLEFYYKKVLYIVFASLVAAITNIILNYVFIPIYGYKAAAYTTLTCYILFGFFHYVCAHYIARHENLEWPFSTIIISLLGLLLLLLTVVVLLIYNYILVRYTFIIVAISFLLLNRKKILPFKRRILKN